MFEKALIFCFISFAIAMLAVAFAALEEPFVDIIKWYKMKQLKKKLQEKSRYNINRKDEK